MNTAETIVTTVLLTITWLGYGLFAAYRTDNTQLESDIGEVWRAYICFMIVSPFIFIGRALIGAFKSYK